MSKVKNLKQLIYRLDYWVEVLTDQFNEWTADTKRNVNELSNRIGKAKPHSPNIIRRLEDLEAEMHYGPSADDPLNQRNHKYYIYELQRQVADLQRVINAMNTPAEPPPPQPELTDEEMGAAEFMNIQFDLERQNSEGSYALGPTPEDNTGME